MDTLAWRDAPAESVPALPGTESFTESTQSTMSARYEALIRVSAALRAYHDRDTLFRSLAHELRPVVSFSFLGLALYDEDKHTVDITVLEASGEAAPLPELTVEESLTVWVVRHQQPLLIHDVNRETRFAQAMKYMRDMGMGSTCALPLKTPQRSVGILLAANREPGAYDGEDVTFLSLVATQVALAIDHASTYGALQAAVALERERQQNLEACDELLRAVSTVLDIRPVFPRVSEIAGTVLPHDMLSLTFHEDDGSLVVHAASAEPGFRGTRLVIDDAANVPDDSVTLVDDFDSGRCPVVEPPDFRQRVKASGFRSALMVRLKAGQQPIGLQFWSRRLGAFDASQVPLARRIADHVALAVSHQRLAEAAREAAEARLRAERLEARVKSLTDELAVRSGFHRAVGSSPQWQAVLKAASQVASTETTVLLVGESGTGKEVVARLIHRGSSRAGGPFVALNCAALPEQLLESELFGYERGAFTGAQQSKPGQIELAAGGVLFLDEVSEMSPSAQAKFLRVLQEREFQRLGGTRALKANVRVIAATNRDLTKAIERSDFREDLFYRLQVFDIKLPALRERPADVLPLAGAFLEEIGQLFGRPPAGLTREAKDALLRYHWPGNVRELRNALERAAILCEGGLITADHLSLNGHHKAAEPDLRLTQTTDLNIVERGLIIRALTECDGNKSRAAARLGISRTQLYVRLRKHKLV